ncbi:MAG: bifunctional N(6)-L-threonylcarbamoyladenine synthase/serine/threonine protein kinase [Thermoplasmata archaeon]
MIVLGIEGTAHTLGIGIMEDEKILANVIEMFLPEKGGIHPREAAIHHSNVFVQTLKKALAIAKLNLKDVELVSFSKGPGLGPCLRTVATAARAISLKLNVPIIGVNHSIAHLEIGKLIGGAEDPIMTYVSGGNTQIISYFRGRYRVFGETLDMGIGNLLDKFAREMGLPFPGGPKIEELAKKGNKYYPLPYSIKGMDVSFSGILTAAKSLANEGVSIENLSYSLQETVFSMMTEVTERALAHLHKDEVLLAGGVARNKRLFEMMKKMTDERGANLYAPPPDLCVDNGVMIAYLGEIMYKSGIRMKIEDTVVDQKFRADSIEAPWVIEKLHYKNYDELPGAEAKITESQYVGIKTIKKERISKGYRINDLDLFLRKERTKREAKILNMMKKFGINAPYILDIDLQNYTIYLTKINGRTLREIFDNLNEEIKRYFDKKIGEYVAILHKNGISHGDLTTSNIMYDGEKIYFIDPSMGELNSKIEEFGTDLHLLKESLYSTHENGMNHFNIILQSYIENYPDGIENVHRMKEIEMRRRYS